MIKNLFSFIAIITIITSCASSKNKSNENVESIKTSSKDSKTELAEKPAELGEANLFATIKRGYCYGTCPVYELKIYANGEATYHGIRNVELEGMYSGHISKENLAALTQKAEEINYMNMEDVYDNPGITDLPSTTTSIVIDGERKEVKRRYGYPTELLALEKLFDEIIAGAEWKKIPEPEKK